MFQIERVLVPAWVCYAAVIAAPLLQFILIRARTHPIIYGLLPFLFSCVSPMILYTEPFRFFAICSGYQIFNFMRICDIAMQPQQMVYSWSMWDYYEIYLTFATSAQRRDLQAKGLSIGSPNAVMPQDRTPQYYGKVAYKIMVQYGVYHLLVWFAEAYPPNVDPTPRQIANIFEPRELLDNLIFGLTLCLMMSINHNLSSHAVAIVFQAPFEPIMNSPFFARSFRDFWSNRWNMTVKESLHRLGFQPALRLLKSITPASRKKDWKIPGWHYVIGGLAAFVVSGLVHEWLIHVLRATPVTGENMLFFAIHGAITTIEVLLSKLGKRWFGFDPIKNIPHWIGTPITLLLFLITSPLFLNPWVRHNLLHAFRVPLVGEFKDTITSHLSSFS